MSFKFDLESLANKEVEAYYRFMNDDLKIPSSFSSLDRMSYFLALLEQEYANLNDSSTIETVAATEQLKTFHQLCDAVPTVPVQNLRLLSLGLGVLVSVFKPEDESVLHDGDMLEIVGALMIASNVRGGLESQFSTNDSAAKVARLSMALMGAEARHKENRVDKAKVFSWCDDNMSRFSSMDDAALDIAQTFVPQKFRAVRGWMTDWRKLRSAGTP